MKPDLLHPCLAVMARAPAAGDPALKSRLAPAVPDPAARASLYRAFLSDVLATGRRLSGVTLRVAHTPADAAPAFLALGLETGELLPQRGASLAGRERSVFEDLFGAGFDPVVLIGSDLPALPLSHLAHAFDLLARHDRSVALGPADDGGYYLMGLRRPGAGAEVPDLFSSIRWSTAHACADTRDAAARAGLRVLDVPGWFDVDDPAALARLRRMLAAAPHLAPATARVLSEGSGYRADTDAEDDASGPAAS